MGDSGYSPYTSNINHVSFFPYTYEIALHESGTHTGDWMQQFNSSTAGVGPETPNWGGPDGWGIMQIDHHKWCTNSGESPVSSNILWNGEIMSRKV